MLVYTNISLPCNMGNPYNLSKNVFKIFKSVPTVTVNCWGRSHFLSYVTICSHIGNKKRLKNSETM